MSSQAQWLMHKFIYLILTRVYKSITDHLNLQEKGASACCLCRSPVIFVTLQANTMLGMWGGYANMLLTLPVVYFCHIKMTSQHSFLPCLAP